MTGNALEILKVSRFLSVSTFGMGTFVKKRCEPSCPKGGGGGGLKPPSPSTCAAPECLAGCGANAASSSALDPVLPCSKEKKQGLNNSTQILDSGTVVSLVSAEALSPGQTALPTQANSAKITTPMELGIVWPPTLLELA